MTEKTASEDYRYVASAGILKHMLTYRVGKNKNIIDINILYNEYI